MLLPNGSIVIHSEGTWFTIEGYATNFDIPKRYEEDMTVEETMDMVLQSDWKLSFLPQGLI